MIKVLSGCQYRPWPSGHGQRSRWSGLVAVLSFDPDMKNNSKTKAERKTARKNVRR